MKRRHFFGIVGGAAMWPLAANAQQAARIPIVGYLGSGTAVGQRTWMAALVRRLRELGWIEGRTVNIEYRWAEGVPLRLAEIAAEFARLKVDVIFAVGTEATIAAKQATSTIPIVFPVAGDPVGSALVASLARPGGNVTGLSNQSVGLGAKRLEILRDTLPGLRRLAILVNAGYSGGNLEVSEIEMSARALGVDLLLLKISRTDDIAPALEQLKSGADALYVIGDPLTHFNRLRINTFALALRLPTMLVHREYVEVGGFISYGPDYLDLNRRAADYVDKILRGAKPADLPVEQPIKFDLAINLITARALGITVPPALLARANEVIE